MCHSAHRQQGVTIVELVIFIVIVGIAAAAILQVVNLATRNSADPLRRKQAMLIAEAYMEEVQQAQFTVCDVSDANAATATIAEQGAGASDPTRCASAPKTFGRVGTKSRPYDNITDYVSVGYKLGNAERAFVGTDSSGKQVDTDVAGNPLGASSIGTTLGNSALDGITTTLALNNVAGLGGLNSDASDPKTMIALRITITTTYGPGQSITLEGYRTRYAPEAR
ncbi:type II secretion system protein [Pseudoduganella sp. FT25W]|uniref:Type II secretion system protein n=1 Tax=Duganella alba TaxID=2666081 RepID=A0A6L5QP83_9BURK|nr:type II secretion system protein [Duganella alba]MRX11676.1 type II secretion system protein [Duganella alba]MRX20005.1 type II secretion system protein [Duganella alba]